eukprot:scaffold1255_cov120-Isochrysis_galbana.AAC.7
MARRGLNENAPPRLAIALVTDACVGRQPILVGGASARACSSALDSVSARHASCYCCTTFCKHRTSPWHRKLRAPRLHLPPHTGHGWMLVRVARCSSSFYFEASRLEASPLIVEARAPSQVHVLFSVPSVRVLSSYLFPLFAIGRGLAKHTKCVTCDTV